MTKAGDSPTFAVGDHVFRWRSYLKIPFAYQEHGIVVRVVPKAAIDCGEGKGESNIDSVTRKTCQDTSIVILNFDAVVDDQDETEAEFDAKDVQAKNKNFEEGVPYNKRDDGAYNVEHQNIVASSVISQTSASRYLGKEKNADKAADEAPEEKTEAKISQDDTLCPEKAASDPRAAAAATAESTKQHRPCRMMEETFSLDDIINSSKTSEEHWEHVQYSQNQWHKRLALRAGTCSPVTPDPIPVIMARIQFLQQHPPPLPNKDSENASDAGGPSSSYYENDDSGTTTGTTTDSTNASIVGATTNTNNNNSNNNVGTIGLLRDVPYDAHKRNGECLAVWCQTGEFISHAGAAKMGQAGLHVGTISLVGGIAAQLAVGAVVPVVLPFMAAADVGGRDCSTTSGRCCCSGCFALYGGCRCGRSRGFGQKAARGKCGMEAKDGRVEQFIWQVATK